MEKDKDVYNKTSFTEVLFFRIVFMVKYFVLSVFTVLPFNANAKVVVFFSPHGNCEQMIVKQINTAQKTVDAAVYSINNDNIVNALLDAKQRGVKIRILTDRIQATGKSSKVKYLYDNNINIRVHSNFKIEHNKFAIYDGIYGSTGSFNWTNPAEKKNSENCIFFDNIDGVLDSYINRFEYLWKTNTKKKSDAWIEKHF